MSAIDLATLARLPELIDRVAQLEKRIAELEAEPAALLTSSELAKLVGTNRRALAERFRREREAGRVHPLEQLRVDIDGVKRWPRSAVMDYLAGVTGKAVLP